MRLRHTAPVTWPNDVAWQRAWADQVKLLDETSVGAGGVVHIPDADPEDPELRLVEGEHLQVGARYLIGGPELSAPLTIEGQQRTARLQYIDQDVPTRRITGELRGLDRLSTLDGAASLPCLEVRVNAAPDPGRLFDLSVELPWLRVSHTARVEQPHQKGQLVVETKVSSRGGWQLLVGPVLAVLGLVARSPHEKWARQLADRLTRLPVDGFAFGDSEGTDQPAAEGSKPATDSTPEITRESLDTSFLATPFSTLGWLRRNAQ